MPPLVLLSSVDELEFLELVYLRCQLAQAYSLPFFSEDVSRSQEDVLLLGLDLVNAVNHLVRSCEEFAKKMKGRTTDRLRSNARCLRKTAKHLLHHAGSPEPDRSQQTDILLNITIEYTSYINTILKLCIKRKRQLQKDQINTAIHITSDTKVKTFEEQIRGIFSESKTFLGELDEISGQVRENVQQRKENELISEFCKQSPLQRQNKVLMKKCDDLHHYLANLGSLIRAYLENTNDYRYRQDLNRLTSSFMTTAAHIILILKGYLLGQEKKKSIPFHCVISSTTNVPYGLKNNTLFHISGPSIQVKILQTRTSELASNLTALEEQMELVQRCVKVKQSRLHQLRKLEEFFSLQDVREHQQIEQFHEKLSTSVQHNEELIPQVERFIIEVEQELKASGFAKIAPRTRNSHSPNPPQDKSPKKMFKRRLKSSLTISMKKRSSEPSPKIESCTVSEQSLPDRSPLPTFRSVSDHIPLTGNILEDEFISVILSEKLQTLTERVGVLHKQTKFKEKILGEDFSRSSKQQFAKIRMIQKETLEELNDLFKTEGTLLSRSAELANQLSEHEAFLVSFKSTCDVYDKNRSILLSEHLKDDQAQFDNVLKAFHYQNTILLESLVDQLPKFRTKEKKTINIWKEALITNGGHKTVIFTEHDDNNQIRAATLNQLITRLTDEKRQHINFQKTFITTFHSFTSPDMFLQKLVERYTVPRDNNSEVSDEQWKQDIVLPIHTRVYNVIRIWLDLRFHDFDYKLMEKLHHFIDNQLQEEHHNFAKYLNRLIKRKIKEAQEESVEEIPVVFDVQPTFLSIPSKVIAQHLTYIDSKFYRDIPAVELCNSSKSRCPKRTRMIDRFNCVSNWFTYNIIQPKQMSERVSCFIKCVEIAEFLHEENNFNGLLAVLSSTRSSPVYRMRKTNQNIPKPVRDRLDALVSLMGSEHNFGKYREMLHSVSPPLVPHMGLYLQDLTFIVDGNPNYLEGLINFRKQELVYRVIEEFQQYQQGMYICDLQDDVYSFVYHIAFHSESELDKISRENEKKQ